MDISHVFCLSAVLSERARGTGQIIFRHVDETLAAPMQNGVSPLFYKGLVHVAPGAKRNEGLILQGPQKGLKTLLLRHFAPDRASLS